MTQDQIIQTTNAFFVEKLDFDASQIEPDAELRRDLGISSVDAVAITTFVQKTSILFAKPSIPPLTPSSLTPLVWAEPIVR